MRKFLIAAAASLFIFGGQADAQAAPTVESLNEQGVQTQEMGKWAHFRDKYILGRDRDRDRHRRDRYRDYPPPRRYDPHDPYDPPPPPPPRGRRYDPHDPYDPPPPPPPRHRRYDPHDPYDPPPPPPPSW